MKKKALLTNTIREIKHSRNRFISIMIIIGMGVGFFVGVKATAPSMMATAKQYFEEQNLMDIKLLSTFGFSDYDIDKINEIEGIEKVIPSYSFDVLLDGEQGNGDVVKTFGLNASATGDDVINRLELVDGRLPEREDECVVELNKFTNSGYKIGDKVTLQEMAGTSKVSEVLKNAAFTVVGTIKSPQYITYDHGTTFVGNGTVSGLLGILDTNYLYPRYTEVYLTCNEDKLDASSDAYSTLIAQISEHLNDLGKVQYEVFKRDTLEQIESGEQELEEKKADANQQLADAKTQLESAKLQIQSAEEELKAAREKLASGEKDAALQIAEGEAQINDAQQQLQSAYVELQRGEKKYREGKRQYDAETASAKEQISNGWNEYNAGVTQVNEKNAELAEAREELDRGWDEYNAGSRKLAEGKDELQQLNFILVPMEQAVNFMQEELDQLKEIGGNNERIDYLQKQLDSLHAQIAPYLEQKKDAEEQIAKGEAELAAAKQKLDDGEAAYDSGKQQINAARDQLNASAQQLRSAEQELEDKTAQARSELEAGYQELQSGLAEYESGAAQLSSAKAELSTAKQKAENELGQGQAQITSGEKELNSAKAELGENEEKYNEAVKDAERQIQDGAKRIQDAKASIGNVDAGIWYVFDRDLNPGYSGLEDDAQRTDAMAGIFPIFFLLVAVLVCLTTMTRMVEENRGEIGILRALGYTKKEVLSKYFIYSGIAGISGSIIGIVLGLLILPKAIVSAYSALYDIPPLTTFIPWGSVIAAFIVALICTVSIAVFVCLKELKERPAQLMRPKAPKEGKRILLERITWLWSRLSFSYKVTCRNLFRYKGRLIMTVIGIAGCTSLITAGLGLQDAISVIVPKQFAEISNYDTIISLRSAETASEGEALQTELNNDPAIENTLMAMQKTVKTDQSKDNLDIYLYVPQSNEKLADFVNLHERGSEEVEQLNDEGVIITEKLASSARLQKGDQITFTLEGKDYQTLVSGITENYVYHYIYMSPVLYQQTLNQEAEFNCIFARTIGTLSVDEKAQLSQKWLNAGELTSMIFTDSIISDFTDKIKSIDAVVMIMILAAGALAIVVLYNLTNINISERIREIATIKVLGFFHREVNMYIFRENIVMTMIGIIFGLILGYFISGFMVTTIEMDMVMFGRKLEISSYFVAAGLTVVFSMFVNYVMSIRMKKISMVESLKSVE